MAEQGVTRVRGTHGTSSFRPVKRQSVVVNFVAPETRFEGVAQGSGAHFKRSGDGALTQLSSQLRAMPPSGIDIGLDLDQRDRAFG
jgi:hypothetical protein